MAAERNNENPDLLAFTPARMNSRVAVDIMSRRGVTRVPSSAGVSGRRSSGGAFATATAAELIVTEDEADGDPAVASEIRPSAPNSGVAPFPTPSPSTRR